MRSEAMALLALLEDLGAPISHMVTVRAYIGGRAFHAAQTSLLD